MILVCLLAGVGAVGWQFAPRSFEAEVEAIGGSYLGPTPLKPSRLFERTSLTLSRIWRNLTGAGGHYDAIRFPAGTVTNRWLLDHRDQLQNHDRLSLILEDSSITDEGVHAFRKMKCLRFLNANGTGVSDTGLRSLASCPNLEAVSIANTEVTAEGVSYLATFPALTSVGVDASQVTDENLSAICQLTAVIHLTVYGATNKTAAQLSSLCEDKKLTLVGSKLTEESLPHLIRIETIQSLTFAGPEIPLEKWRRFSSALDGCQIPRPTEVESPYVRSQTSAD